MTKVVFCFMENQIFDVIFNGDEVTWQALLMDLVKAENMDPWDVDVSDLTVKYIEMLKKMQELDLRISGKVVLAAALLLKFKSNYLLGEEMLNFDKLLHPEEYTDEGLYDNPKPRPDYPENTRLIPKTPQPRKRKVSIYELVDALRQALEVKKRRREILEAINIPIPERKVDISIVIADLHSAIERLLQKQDSVYFSELIPTSNKRDVIGLFLPLLHLSNQRKVDLDQQTHFGEIEISMAKEDSDKKSGSAMNVTPDLTKKHDFINDALEESDK